VNKTERETCSIKTNTETEDSRHSPAQNAEGKRQKSNVLQLAFI